MGADSGSCAQLHPFYSWIIDCPQLPKLLAFVTTKRWTLAKMRVRPRSRQLTLSSLRSTIPIQKKKKKLYAVGHFSSNFFAIYLFILFSGSFLIWTSIQYKEMNKVIEAIEAVVLRKPIESTKLLNLDIASTCAITNKLQLWCNLALKIYFRWSISGTIPSTDWGVRGAG